MAGPNEYVTAVLGWTGSRQFERSLRDYAAKVSTYHDTFLENDFIHVGVGEKYVG